MIKAVIFDIDGVLIDSVQMGLRARRHLLAQYGVDLDTVPDPQGEGHRATSLKMLLACVKDYTGVEIDPHDFAALSRQHMRAELQTLVVDPGLVAFLEDLKSHKIACAVASSGLREGVEYKLNLLGIKSYFSVIVTAAEVEEHKPHPAPYLYAMKQLGVSPQDCVIFEDSLTGIQAGCAAGCAVIGFTQYNQPHGAFPDVAATINSWNDVSFEKLKRLLSR